MEVKVRDTKPLPTGRQAFRYQKGPVIVVEAGIDIRSLKLEVRLSSIPNKPPYEFR